jgi:mRNA interferase RelE/StbE
MARFEMRLRRSVAKDLLRPPKADNRRLAARIEALADDPRPHGHEKLAGSSAYRIRQGDYRIIHTIDDGTIVVEIIRVGPRREVYRD